MYIDRLLLAFVSLCIWVGEGIFFVFSGFGRAVKFTLFLTRSGFVKFFSAPIIGLSRFIYMMFRRPKKAKRKLFSLNYYLFFYRIKYFVFGFIIAFILFAAQWSVDFIKRLPNPSLVANYNAGLSTHIYSRGGKLLYEVYREQNRTPVTLQELPEHLKHATIAIEDKDFYRHQGVSLIGGVLRAAKESYFGDKLQGGSTITQQLVKSALLTPERTIERKVKEIILALLVERSYSKDQILEMYLNQVPYGGTAWGVEEAARMYFGKSATKLNLAESALLAGLPQAPSLYSPYTNPEAAKSRQLSVLQRMYEDKYITKDELNKAKKVTLTYKTPRTSILAPHFVFYIKNILEREYGLKTVQEGGLRVYTTIDYDIQREAERILKEEIEEISSLNVGNGAVLVTRPSTGEILAMVGSKDFFEGESGAFNVTTALRQPGSSIKPINYAVGIDRHIVTAATPFVDAAVCFNIAGQKPYCPKNYDGKFHGLTQLRFALANSYNIPAVKMLAMNTVTDFIASASAFGITSFTDPSRYGLSLTLGGGEVTMTDMAKAFSAFPNQGVPKDLVGILKITDREGKVLYEYKDPNYVKDVQKPVDYPNYLMIQGKRVISPETAFIISHILLDNGARGAAFGPSSQLVVPGRTGVSVKTGTTDDLKDNWTIGYSPNFLTLVWVGNNDNTPMNPYLVSGITGAAPIWNRVMSYVLKNQKDLWPKKPDGVLGMEVCSNTGGRPNVGGDGQKSCPVRFEYFIRGAEPKEVQPVKRKVFINKTTGQIAKEGDPEVEEQEKLIIQDQYGTFCLDCPSPEEKK